MSFNMKFIWKYPDKTMANYNLISKFGYRAPSHELVYTDSLDENNFIDSSIQPLLRCASQWITIQIISIIRHNLQLTRCFIFWVFYSKHTRDLTNPSSLSTIKPINHWAYWPSILSASHQDFYRDLPFGLFLINPLLK